MSDTRETPAFPTVAGQIVYSHGMTLRDWFAGQALAGRMGTGNEDYLDPEDTADRCYRAADAMIAARQKDAPHD